MIVLDASAMVEWLEHSTLGLKVDRKILRDGDRVRAPHFIDLEVTSAISKKVRLGGMRLSRGEQVLRDLQQAPCMRYPHRPFLPRIWKLRENLSPYDAAYVALAEFLGATLLTCDAKLSRAPGHSARIDLVS